MKSDIKQFVEDISKDTKPDLSKVVDSKVISHSLKKIKEVFLEDDDDLY